MKIHTLTIVGVGLIGGSIGMVARRCGLAAHVLGVGRRQASLDLAWQQGAIDEGTFDLAGAVERADFAVFCTAVDCIPEQVLAAAGRCRPGILLTDAGSTKAAIVAAIDGRLPRGVAFVGSHPLAGSEKRGPQHARADLFEGRLTIVTRTEQTDSGALERVADFWQALGSHVKVMSPEDHDRALALTSHLPHLLAAGLAGIVPPELYELTASGFRDCTRVAAGDPELWTGIFLQNRLAVLDALDRVHGRLADLRRALMASDRQALDALLTQAKKARDALGNNSLSEK
jgi:prephenate dehydrogenase